VQLAAREQRRNGGVDLPGVIVADEDPVLAPYRLPTQRRLRLIVMDWQGDRRREVSTKTAP